MMSVPVALPGYETVQLEVPTAIEQVRSCVPGVFPPSGSFGPVISKSIATAPFDAFTVPCEHPAPDCAALPRSVAVIV
jgi:hypothetical protein